MKGREYILVKNPDAAGAGHTMTWAETGSGRIVENGKISSRLSDFIERQRRLKLIELDEHGKISKESTWDEESEDEEVFVEVTADDAVLGSYIESGAFNPASPTEAVPRFNADIDERIAIKPIQTQSEEVADSKTASWWIENAPSSLNLSFPSFEKLIDDICKNQDRSDLEEYRDRLDKKIGKLPEGSPDLHHYSYMLSLVIARICTLTEPKSVGSPLFSDEDDADTFTTTKPLTVRQPIGPVNKRYREESSADQITAASSSAISVMATNRHETSPDPGSPLFSDDGESTDKFHASKDPPTKEDRVADMNLLDADDATFTITIAPNTKLREAGGEEVVMIEDQQPDCTPPQAKDEGTKGFKAMAAFSSEMYSDSSSKKKDVQQIKEVYSNPIALDRATSTSTNIEKLRDASVPAGGHDLGIALVENLEGREKADSNDQREELIFIDEETTQSNKIQDDTLPVSTNSAPLGTKLWNSLIRYIGALTSVDEEDLGRIGIDSFGTEEDEDFMKFLKRIQNDSSAVASELAEHMNLYTDQRNKAMRDADTITSQMIQESQVYLRDD
ncbi:hypothetical protein HDU96_005397 [Phlyctochytrium bullatum]|nr:hypothetical protein HDU96_005397 [Phlyctochytrium bullatum]